MSSDVSRTFRASIAAAVVLAVLGCNPIVQVEGGMFDSISHRFGREGPLVEARAGMFSGSLGGTMGIRSKFSSELTQIAISQDFFFMPLYPRLVTPFLRAGVNNYQFESLDDAFGYGMFSPYAEVGALIRISEDQSARTWLSLGVGIEHDIRFTSQPNESYWSLRAGLWFSEETPPMTTP
jgi:hypothetical protein